MSSNTSGLVSSPEKSLVRDNPCWGDVVELKKLLDVVNDVEIWDDLQATATLFNRKVMVNDCNHLFRAF